MQRTWQTTVYRFVATAGSQRLTAGRGGVAPEDVRFSYWQTAAPVTLTYDAEQHERAGARIAAAIGQIAARIDVGEEAFERTPDPSICRHCPYRSYCDRGREAAPGIDVDDPDDEGLWDPPPRDTEE